MVTSAASKYSNSCYLSAFITELKSDDHPFFFYNLFGPPEKYEISAHQKNSAVITVMQDIINESGATVVQRNNVPFKYESVSAMEGHPSSKTHQLYAESLYKEIVENKSWTFTQDD
jgi:hypothetical protein